jgi:predicted TIM-barrel fold metal-dependent hydrolase
MSPDGGRPAGAPVMERQSRSKLKVIDCDIHHALHSPKDLHPYLSRRWQHHLDSYGHRHTVPFIGSSPYPKAAPALSRTDSWPPTGGPPGSDLAFLQEQLLDRYNVEYGMLHLLSPQGMDQRNQEFGAAICRAVNEWQCDRWTRRDRRLKAAIVVPGEDAAAAVAEIEHWAGNPDFVQVSMVTHTIEPLGRRRYWPVYEAASAHGLPIGLHTSGFNGHAVTGGGWPSYYVEEQHDVALSQQAVLISLVCEGVFERFPTLKVVIVEAGFAWVPPVAWRLDAAWKRMCDEVPHLQRKPSEVIRQHIWFTTQPTDEPERPEDLRTVLDWIGWDRVLFATDYPHWDMDNPDFAFKCRMTEAERRMIYADNARAVYGLN